MVKSTTGQVCFTCYFLEGSQSQGCYIEYNSLITDYYSGNITIVRTSVDTSTASKCVTEIYISNYNVTFYDMDYNNVPYTTEYAVKLTNQLVIGLSLSFTPTISNVIVTLSSLSPVSNTLCRECNNSKLIIYIIIYHHINQLVTGVSPFPYSMTNNSMSPSSTTFCTVYENSKLLLIF